MVPVAVCLRLIVQMSVVAGKLLPTILSAAFADLCSGALSAAEQLCRHTEMLDRRMPSITQLWKAAGTAPHPPSPAYAIEAPMGLLNQTGKCCGPLKPLHMVQGVVGVWNSEHEFFGHVRL